MEGIMNSEDKNQNQKLERSPIQPGVGSCVTPSDVIRNAENITRTYSEENIARNVARLKGSKGEQHE
jgi:hypothetical protein